MQALIDQGVCLFCPPHVDARVVRRSDHWVAVANDFPYAATSDHLLLIPTEHVTSVLDLTPEAQVDLWNLLYDIAAPLPHFSLFVRNGDAEFTGATVAHLHLHVVVAATTTGIRVRLG